MVDRNEPVEELQTLLKEEDPEIKDSERQVEGVPCQVPGDQDGVIEETAEGRGLVIQVLPSSSDRPDSVYTHSGSTSRTPGPPVLRLVPVPSERFTLPRLPLTSVLTPRFSLVDSCDPNRAPVYFPLSIWTFNRFTTGLGEEVAVRGFLQYRTFKSKGEVLIPTPGPQELC